MAKNKKLYAVYGSLKKGFHNHGILGDSRLVGECKSSPNFTMLDLGAFPGVVRQGSTAITLEVYEVVDEKIESRLDRLEGFKSPNSKHNFYNKEMIDTEFGPAYLYTFNEENINHLPIVESGNW